MSEPAQALRDLLESESFSRAAGSQVVGAGGVRPVRWSESVAAGGMTGRGLDGQQPAWSLLGLRGRVVELVGGGVAGSGVAGSGVAGSGATGSGANAQTTVAVSLVREAQELREPVVWLTHSEVTFFPPDVVDCGVELEALTVVRLPETGQLLRAVDTLLRSGAFGLAVVDFAEGASVPLAAQARLVGLCKRHEAVLVCLGRAGGGVTAGGVTAGGVGAGSFRARRSRGSAVASSSGQALGSFASLRAECRRRRVGDGEFEWEAAVLKDKKWGREWSHREACRAVEGLR